MASVAEVVLSVEPKVVVSTADEVAVVSDESVTWVVEDDVEAVESKLSVQAADDRVGSTALVGDTAVDLSVEAEAEAGSKVLESTKDESEVKESHRKVEELVATQSSGDVALVNLERSLFNQAPRSKPNGKAAATWAKMKTFKLLMMRQMCVVASNRAKDHRVHF
jgi:hypothetical protein